MTDNILPKEGALVKDKKFLSGWPLGFWDGAIVLGFSLAPLIFQVGTILLYPRYEEANRDTIEHAFAEYFGNGDIMFVALAVAGSVAAKVWLDIRYREYSNAAFNAPIVICGLLAAMVQTGKILDFKPDLPAMVLISLILLGAAMWTYVWLIANPPEDHAQSVSKTLQDGANKLADQVKKLQAEEKHPEDGGGND